VILQKLKNRVENSSLWKMINLIQKRKTLFDSFKEDFLCHSLGLYSLNTLEKEVYLSWINIHVVEKSVIDIYMMMDKKEANLGYLNSVMAPLSAYFIQNDTS